MGNQVEVFWGAQVADEPFKPGPLGLGHVVVTAESAELVQAMMAFYCDHLGFRLTDYYSQPFEARFLHVNQRHHSLAIVQGPKNGFHHVMTELYSFDDIGQGYDLVTHEDRVAATLGRHTRDYMTSFYAWTPSRFMIEYGWGGRSIDVEAWQPFERAEGPSMWGHERHWAPQEMRERAREMRHRLAADGKRVPLQVMEGNFSVQPGVCPWWDGISGSAGR